MKLHVHVIEARDLAARDPNGLSDPFVRLQMGNTKTKTAVIYRNLSPVWNEEFFFNVVGSDEELQLLLWDEDRFSNDFLGQVMIPVGKILTADKQTITREWFPLQKRNDKSKFPITGEILLSLSLFGKDTSSSSKHSTGGKSTSSSEESSLVPTHVKATGEDESILSPTSSMDMSDCSTECSNLLDVPTSPNRRGFGPATFNPKHDEDLVKEFDSLDGRHNKAPKTLADRFSSVFNKKTKHSVDGSSRHGGDYSPSRFCDSPKDVPAFSDGAVEASSDDELDVVGSSFFENDGKRMDVSSTEDPTPLSGGVVLNQKFSVSFKALSGLICKPCSPFIQDLLMVLKTTEYVEEPWRYAGDESIKRVVTYMKAATKMLKSVKATETQTCRRIDDRGFIVSVSCATPDVPYGNSFLVELQFCILAGQDSLTGEKTCHLEVSWRVNFLQQTIMKGMIENGARQGIRETYETYREVISKYAKPFSEDLVAEEFLAVTKDVETPLSDWELVRSYFGKYHVLLAVLSLLLVLVHIWFAPPKLRAILVRWGFDLPDTMAQFIFSAVVVLQVENVVKMVHQFIRARYWQSGDHGVKAQGDGWLMTVTLIEGEYLSPTEECSFANPYVVFTCSGKRRTSSVKLRTLNPHWREIFEFDATEDPPSTMDVEVFDYDGPFSDAESLGHAEINFLKQSPNELADFWISLSGKNARTHGSRLHLRVFLTNTKQSDALPEYLERVEKEVGTKVVKRSAQKNGSFQKLFALPAEEFLINDFACAIKRKILIQVKDVLNHGRLFLSPRLLGFYSNLFGIKTKFTFIWEDIEEIKETSVAINPSIVIFLRKGRGLDARNGAKGTDSRGRVKFQFLSFVRPSTAFRTITALWKNRKLSPEQQMELVANVEAVDKKYLEGERQADDAESFVGMEEAHMSQVCSFEIPLTMETVMTLFEKGKLEQVVAQQMGYINWKSSAWERVDGQQGCVERRQFSYNLNRQISQFGSKVSCIQQRTKADNMRSCVFDEVFTLHDVPFGDHFQVQAKREIDTLSTNPAKSYVKASVGVAWHKNTEFKKSITKNVHEHMAKEIREMMNISVKEIRARAKNP